MKGRKLGNEASAAVGARFEEPKRGNEASAAAAALLGRTENASAAAGARFGTTGGAEMGPVLQREQHLERPKTIGF